MPDTLTVEQEQVCPTLTNVGGASLPRVLPENDHQTPDTRATTERLESDSQRFLRKLFSDASVDAPVRYAIAGRAVGPNRSRIASDWVQ